MNVVEEQTIVGMVESKFGGLSGQSLASMLPTDPERQLARVVWRVQPFSVTAPATTPRSTMAKVRQVLSAASFSLIHPATCAGSQAEGTEDVQLNSGSLAKRNIASAWAWPRTWIEMSIIADVPRSEPDAMAPPFTPDYSGFPSDVIGWQPHWSAPLQLATCEDTRPPRMILGLPSSSRPERRSLMRVSERDTRGPEEHGTYSSHRQTSMN